jgi:hypothetical protein|tara:strand:- start:3794 stop:3991 length:198 start_codon:yes stop_codon:yes gene_type:complete
MARPNKIEEETKSYNLLMTQAQWDKLSHMANEQQKTSMEQVSVADLIREAIDLTIEIYEEDNEEA